MSIGWGQNCLTSDTNWYDENNCDEFPFILTTGRILEHYNCGTMTRRTGNKDIVSEDILAINPKDADNKGVVSGDKVRIFSERGEVELDAVVSSEVKPGILYTTFHFPEHMVNQVTSEEKDEESMCPEYKVSAVDFEKVSPSDSAENKTEETVSSGRKIKHAPVAGGGSS